MQNFVICAPPNIFIITKSSWMRWTGHVVSMEKARNAYILVGKAER